MKCKHCGDTITVVTALGMLLGENGSYYCNPDTSEVFHELATN